MQTPDFKGTKLFDRLCWAKENLEARIAALEAN